MQFDLGALIESLITTLKKNRYLIIGCMMVCIWGAASLYALLVMTQPVEIIAIIFSWPVISTIANIYSNTDKIDKNRKRILRELFF